MSVNLLIETVPSPLTISKPMTAGSDPQPAESSTAPKMPSIASIRHIPMDHNYGQPPPMTPPDSNSPGPEDGDTGNEDEEDDGVTRCICEFDHDDGYMICCDKCSVWQHIECMGISSDAVPENYLCDQCQPRTLDRERARAIQQRKREDQSDDDDDDEDSEEERETPSYTAISNTPTRITLTAKVTQKRKRGPNKIKVKDQNIPPVQGESTDKEKKPKRRRRQKQKPPQGFVPVDEDTNEAWENSYSSYDHYEEVKENIYGKELEELSLNSGQENGYLPAVAGDDQLCKVVEVQRYKKGIVAIEDMDKNKFIIQCKGKLMLLSKFEAENPFFKRCSPYVFYYSKLDHLQLCVDARTHGNDARFVRRSCSPNSEVKHFFLNGRVCLGIFSSAPLPRGAEITIPFEFQFEEYHSNLDCACAQDSCAVMKYNLRFQNQIQDGHTQKRFKPHDEDSNSGSHQKMSPLKVSLANSHGMQGDSDSDIENNPEKRAKKSREDRKLEAYVRQIEKMEKKEKRKQQSQKEVKPELVSPVSQEVPFNKLCSKNMKGMKRSLNKKRAGTPGIKRKRARLSSCSSEPLSPDEHSSTASTPTTPKVSSVVSLPEVPESFCTYGTPSTSPNGSFRFPKDEKQSADEEIKEMFTKETVTTVTTEPADNSGPSSPSSPITPVDDSELNLKPAENVATSTTVQDPVPDERIDVATSATESLCTSTTESTQLSKEVNSNSVSECLVEINVSVGSGRNTPSPCPSTAGSPTSAESVMSGYSGCASERISPGPAPGSPVASVKFGPRATRTSPFYGSLKKYGDGNPRPEDFWPSEDYWKEEYPSLFSHSSHESQTQKQQIPAETRLSIHDSTFFAHEQDTAGIFPAPPDPTADPMLAGPFIPTAHGSSHGLTPAATYSGNLFHNFRYPQRHSSADIHTDHHSAASTILTPGGSSGYNSYLFRGSDLSTVTQDEPKRDTRRSTQDVPSNDPGTAGLVPVPLHSGAPIPTSPFSGHILASFSEHPLRHRVLESPSLSWQPRSTFPGYPYPRSSGISTDGLTPVHPGYLPLRGMQDPQQQRGQPQSTMPGDLNLKGSAVTYPHEIPGFLPSHGMQGARLHRLQPQSTMSNDPYLIGPGVSTHSYSTVNLESLPPHETLTSPQYGFHSQSTNCPSYPHLQFSGPVTSSVTHPPVIPGYSSYPYGNRMRAPLQASLPQSASQGEPHLSGPMSSVIHPPVSPGYFYPYGNSTRDPLLAPQPQSASPVPREIKAQGPEAKVAYRNALKTGKVKVYRARIMLIGQDRAGKTSLKKSFLGLPFDPEEDSTDGIEVDPSKFEVDVDQVKNWKRTDKKSSVSQFAFDLAKMVAKEIQERGKDKEEDDEEDGDGDYVKEGKQQKAKYSKLDDPDEDTNKQTKMGQSGLSSLGEPRLSKPPVVNSQMNQDTSRNARKETKTEAPAVELNIDATLPPEEFTDYLDQILKGLNLQTDATAVEHHMILDLWDFAGQQLYYASYPVFLSPRAVYMLVYDLSKGLNDLAQPCFKQGDRKIPLGNPNKETNVENLLSWLVSVSSICSSESEKAVKDQSHCRPPVFIVGTHADDLKQHQEDIDKIKSRIKSEIFENSQNVIRPIFSVDNTQGSSDRGVSALQKRMIEVLKQEPYMGEEIPIRWFNFEKVVKALVAEEVYHLNMEELQTIIQKHCFIENKDEVATMLNFYHDLGVIVKHGNTVILQAEWLIKLFKQLITVRCFDDMEPSHCRLWKEMEKTGVLNMELVEHVFSEFRQQGVVKEDILKMMMKFGLIVQFAPSATEEKYFVPCQLRSPPYNLCIKELSPGDPCPLYLDFQRMGYVPHGLYLQLVSRCTKWCSTSGFKKPPKLYDGSSVFFIGKELITHQMILVCKKRFIKIVLKQIKRNDGSSCEPVSAKKVPILVRTFFNEMMQNLPEALPWLKNVAYDLCVKCPYCLKVEKPCDNHDQFPCGDERCLCLMTVAPDGSCEYCLESHLDEILPLPELERWFPSSSEDSSIKDTSEEEVEIRTVPQERLSTSIRQFPDKTGYQVKEGIPSDDDLELLSVKVEKWKRLGRRLKLEDAELTALHQENDELSEKAFAMLKKWKQKNASDATYRCLYDALCHKLVNRKDLAEEFCCRCSKPEG